MKPTSYKRDYEYERVCKYLNERTRSEVKIAKNTARIIVVSYVIYELANYFIF